jgi:hypothetical protein
MADNLGYAEGDICNRDGCEGIIEELEKDGCCSCHTGNPPCGYCMIQTGYCPICEWEAENA